MKIITGGQSGADLAGVYFAIKHGIEVEINAEKNYHPLYDNIPNGVKINIVSNKKGYSGGWIERRRFNILNSDFTVILIGRLIELTRGSKGTLNDCVKFNKDCMYINIFSCKGSIIDYSKGIRLNESINSLDEAKEILKYKNIQVLNIAGERNLDVSNCVIFLDNLIY